MDVSEKFLAEVRDRKYKFKTLFSKTFPLSLYMAIQVMVFFALGELLLAYPFGILLRDWRKESLKK